MLRRQGRHLPPDEIEKITRLLATTDLRMADIADGLGCSKSTINTVNRKYRIRIYNTKRNQWTLNEDLSCIDARQGEPRWAEGTD